MPELNEIAVLPGHNGWITSVATSSADPTIVATSSRDRTAMIWKINPDNVGEDEKYGVPVRSFRGHNHFVSDVTFSEDASYILTGSWDATLRLWEVDSGVCSAKFVNHTKDVLSVGFSRDNRKVVSAGRDHSVRVWNTVGQTVSHMEEAHTDWVSCVAFSPLEEQSIVVSGGWDGVVKVINTEVNDSVNTLTGHEGYVNTVTISPDGSLCASGGKDGVVRLWDLTEGRCLYTLKAGDIVHGLSFSPSKYQLAAATESGVVVWDLEKKDIICEHHISGKNLSKHATPPYATSLAWGSTGEVLYVGCTDSNLHVLKLIGA